MDYSRTIEETSGNSERNISNSGSLEWQVDSDWIDLSSTSLHRSSGKKGSKSKPSSASIDNPRFYFTDSSKGGRFLIIDQQALRLSQTTDSGFSYWVCNIPCCNAQCILDPEEKKMIRYNGDHNHGADVSRDEYRTFINALKNAVKENPHVKPKALFQKELKNVHDRWEDLTMRENINGELWLPEFEDVKAAMYNTRNAILSAFSLRPTEDSKMEDKASSNGRNRSTRSNDGKKSSKAVSPSAADLDEVENMWTSQAHKDASLSDFEEWLDDDVSASQGSAMSKSEQLNFSNDNEGDLWDATNPLEKIPRRKYRKRPASLSVFTCTHCPYKSNRHFNVQRHERLAHSSKKPEYNCKECGTSYSLEYRLKLHIKAVHQGEGHHCHICSRTFETMTGLKSHLVTKHKNDGAKVQRELPPELTCKLCCRVFTTKAHLLKHTSTHVMVQPYRCYSCNQPFLDECTWLTHQNNCNEAFTIQCCLCSRVIPSAQQLLTHMDEVHGRAEYSCNCGKAFPWKKSLLTHQQKCSLYLAEKAPIPLS